MRDDERETISGSADPETEKEPLGAVYGNVTSRAFKCLLTDRSVKEMEMVEVHHPVEGWVLGSIDDIELRSDMTQDDAAMHIAGRKTDVSYRRIATVKMIGRRDEEGRLKRPLTPILPSSKIFRPEPGSIQRVIGLDLTRDNGAYIGKIQGSDVDVVLDPFKLVQNHVSIIAKSGSGKSYACGVMVEEFKKHNIPVVILDLHGEYRSLISPNIDEDEYERMERFGVSPEGLGDSVSEFALSGNPEDPSLTLLGIDIRKLNSEDMLDLMGVRNLGAGSSVLYTAMNRVREILEDDYDLYDIVSAVQTDGNPAKWNVLNGLEHLQRIPLFSNSPTPLTQIVRKGQVTVIEMKDAPYDVQQIGAAALLNRLFDARKSGLIPPFMLIVEEAHNFCPQSGPAITSKVLRTIASEGRKFGMGLTIVSQRPAKVDKNVLSQCGTQIILKVTNPNDLKAVIASVEGLTTRMTDEIQRLPVATAIVVGGSITDPVLTEVRTRKTRHGGGSVDILKDLESRET